MRTYIRQALSSLVLCMVMLGLPVALFGRVLLIAFNFQRISYWTGTPILTLAQKAASERLLGVRAIVLVRTSYHINPNFDIVLTQWCKGRKWALYPLTAVAFLVMLATASKVHTFADSGLLPSIRQRRVSTVELLSLRLFRIPHLVWTYGADVRTRKHTLMLGPKNCCTDCSQLGKACVCDDAVGARNMLRLRNNGSIVFSMGDMIEYTPGSRNNLFFWPLDLEGTHAYQLPLKQEIRFERRLRVVHAPNHREFKGTRYLETAIKALQSEGVPIDLIMVENLPNQEAIEIYRTADIIFDQCLIGFHGYFALEAMALGKPVMCFIRKPDEYLLHPDECPIINTHIDTLKEDLRHLTKSPDALRAIGEQGRIYVEKYYSRVAFAGRLKKAYEELGIIA